MGEMNGWFVGALLGPLSIMLAVYTYGIWCEIKRKRAPAAVLTATGAEVCTPLRTEPRSAPTASP